MFTPAENEAAQSLCKIDFSQETESEHLVEFFLHCTTTESSGVTTDLTMLPHFVLSSWLLHEGKTFISGSKVVKPESFNIESPVWKLDICAVALH
ncbi:hypothetical protein [Bufonid herpesvirus 1]|uniref:hypothetical protein n=1 Tax=Bufonid herpesvirus 1 TaxID=2282206 RepID=UPI000EB6C239|nr:hypothetical protein [Bufonid herpesvirus 1]AXF48620.1 hypothetical protein [Bufonid herpesvirus 1]